MRRLLVGCALFLAACGGSGQGVATTTFSAPTIDPRAAASIWFTDNGYLLDDINQAISTAADDAQLGLDQARAGCVGISDAVFAAEQTEPIPLASIDRHWRAGLALLDRAAQACVDAIDASDPTGFDRGIALLDRAQVEMDRASAALNAL